jgi:hypothetical protein
MKEGSIILTPFGERGFIHSINEQGDCIVLTSRECETFHIYDLRPYPVKEDVMEAKVKNAQYYAFWFFSKKSATGDRLFNQFAFNTFCWAVGISICAKVGYEIGIFLTLW